MNQEKQRVKDFWDVASCGEELFLKSADRRGYEEQSISRFSLEGGMIDSLADFEGVRGMRMLEIGVGLGADHQKFAEAGAILYGIDLTERAIEHTKRRLSIFNLESILAVGDAENLEFEDCFFDRCYSWGVSHHSPNTAKAVSEVWRVLKPGGQLP